MATTAAILEIAVRADTTRASSSLTQLNSGLSRTAAQGRTATRETDRLNRTTSKIGPTLANAAKTAIGLGAAYVGLSAARQAVDATTDLASATISLKKNFGLSIKTASGLGAALVARGGETSTLSTSFNKLSKEIEAAKDSAGSSRDAFKSLGITQKELQNSTADEKLFMIADGMKELGKGTERTKVQSQLFGRSASKELIPVLREGSTAVKEQIALAEKYGASFRGKPIESIKDLISAQRELAIAQLGMQIQFTEKVAPALMKIGLAIAGATNAFSNLNPILVVTVGLAAALALAFISPVAAIGLAAAVIILNWGKITKAFKDGLEFIKKHAVLIGAALVPFTGAFFLLVALVYKNWDKIKGAFSAGVSFIKNVWGGIKDVLAAPFSAAVGAITGFINKIIDVVNTVLGPIGVEIGDVGGGGGGKVQGRPTPDLPFRRQRGGIMVPGTGSGDKVRALLEPGEFVLNRNAVAALGANNLNALNSAVPRFQWGGAVRLFGGGSLPGPSPGEAVGAVKDFPGKVVDFTVSQALKMLPGLGAIPGWLKPGGQFVLDKVKEFVKDKIGLGGGSASWETFDQLARQAGLSITSTLRSGSGSFHNIPMDGGRARATDYADGPTGMMRFAKAMLPYATSGKVRELFYDPLGGWDNGVSIGPIGGHMDHVHVALQKGGVVNPQKAFGSSLDVNELTTLAKFVGMPRPALMAAIAMGESSGIPGRIGDGGDSVGLWQINKPSWGGSNAALSNPFTNAKYAKKVLRQQGLDAWTIYNTGAYRQFLGGRVKPELLARLRGQKPAAGGKGGGGTTETRTQKAARILASPKNFKPAAVKWARSVGAGGGGGGDVGGAVGEDPALALAEAQRQLAEEIEALRKEIGIQNAIAKSELAIGLAEARRAFADMLSGELGGRVTQRGHTAGAGAVVRA